MSWWTKHRKELLGTAGLLGLGATGFGLAGMGPLAGLLSGGTGAAGAGAAGAGVAGATADVGAAEAAREAAMAGLSKIPQGLGSATSLGNTGYSVGGGLHAATGGLFGGGGMSAGQASTALAGMNLLNQSPQAIQPAPPPPPARPMPPSTFAGYGEQPPPGVDPAQWATLPDVLKKYILSRGGQS